MNKKTQSLGKMSLDQFQKLVKDKKRIRSFGKMTNEEFQNFFSVEVVDPKPQTLDNEEDE